MDLMAPKFSIDCNFKTRKELMTVWIYILHPKRSLLKAFDLNTCTICGEGRRMLELFGDVGFAIAGNLLH